MSLSREWLGASEISTLWINYVDIRPSEPLFTSTMGWMVENLFSKKCSWDRLLLIVECHCVATQWINHFFWTDYGCSAQ